MALDELLADLARRHGLSEGAVRALWDALVAGGGGQAQFSHPDLGGMGQWSGGMVQIGDMFNTALKAKVAAVCAELAPAAKGESSPAGAANSGRDPGAEAPRASVPRTGSRPHGASERAWWPGGLGQPSSTGSQNATRYACFPDRRRLAVERDGHLTVYDTGEHRITGFSQSQSTCSAMTFTSQMGPVMLDALRIVEE